MIFFQIQSKDERFDSKRMKLRLKHNNEFELVPYVSPSLFRHLFKIKNDINNYSCKWDRFKKFTNVYEYVHTVIPDSKYAICKLKPLSRSFYKMIEIMSCFHVLKEIEEKGIEKLRTFHLAEGPGGFIEAMQYVRQGHSSDVYYGMTLQSQNQNTPGWKKSAVLMQNRSFVADNGADGSGDVTRVANFRHCVAKYAGSMHIVTADGGFDFTVDFNKQEVSALRLIIAEVFTALAMQKKGGYFVLKVYDIFMRTTIEIIYMLCNMYESVFLYKPHTSRTANSEKYIICKSFENELTPEWVEAFDRFMCKLEASSDYVVESIFDFELDNMFVTKMNDICSVIGQQQLDNISSTLSLILNPKNEKVESYKRNNIQNCISWCIKHNLPYNDYKKVGVELGLGGGAPPPRGRGDGVPE